MSKPGQNRLKQLIGSPKTLLHKPKAFQKPIGQFFEPRRLSANHVKQIAPGDGRKSGSVHISFVMVNRQQRFMQWNGIRQSSSWRNGSQPRQSDAQGVLAVLFGASAVAVLAAPVVSWVQNGIDGSEKVVNIIDSEECGPATFRLADVVTHDRSSSTKWVIHGRSVYDITSFIDAHPGGEVILRACGGSIDPYWKLFSIHNKPEVEKILDGFYIGDLDQQDIDAEGNINWSGIAGSCIDDPFKDDPERDPELIVRTPKPCNAETPGRLLGDFITPLRLFFVRHHLWVPKINASEHKLAIELSDGDEISYSLEDLKSKFPEYTITATLQCAGNRRSHMSVSENGKTSGLQWDIGAIGTAEFTGVRLRDVLLDAGYDVDKACGVCPNDPDADQHIHFCAPADTYEQSIPLQTALNPASDVLLAWKMNGQDMPRDHGGPLRAIVPGSVATRSVKWLGKAEDWEAAQSIQEMPVQSAITDILRSNGVDTPVRVNGFAFSGGGRKIVRVDVSADGGKTWRQACLRKGEAKGTRRWAWTQWTIEWPKDKLPEQKPEFVVKAVDEGYNTQPQTFDATWNFRGLLGNAWHRVPMET
ncbi:Putative oxidoreductase, molybdopterin-binding domain, eukaryotic molybdopterin oxidoreductase [Septoria linicola]|uniref:Nitrate reductase [NADPH] n=1 Tax=Septoria linicola TaxID=215465 RepID=A0A9Q9B1A3_9PEZI|nr:Putative oxidoreductase, molybdopterin-binding domain, eukaryotic molybdopterin oxidoreductase [Septoria linicola]